MILRKLSAFTVICAVFCLNICAFADEPISVNETTGKTPMSFNEFYALSAMKLLGDDLLDMSEDEEISRAQFVGNLFKVAGFSKFSCKNSDIEFIDVNTQTPYCDEICSMYILGFINGTSEKTFSPNDSITYIQAVKLVVDVLGYREFSTAKYGEYPQGYIGTANYLNLAKGIQIKSTDEKLTVKKAVKLLYNAGRTNVMKTMGADKNGNISYEVNKGEELLNQNNHIYYAEGIMQSNGIVSLVEQECSDNITTISGVEYVSADSDLTGLIGCSVKYFYKNEANTKQLLWAWENPKNKVLNVRSEDLLTNSPYFTTENVVYSENGKKHEIKIHPYRNFIYNNSLYNDAPIEKLKPKSGNIKFIDNDNDNIYDTVIVEEFINLFVDTISTGVSYISDKYNKTINLNDYDFVKIIKNGKPIELSDIGGNILLSCLEDKNKEKLFVYVNDKVFQEQLIATKDDEDCKIYEFLQGSYRLANSYKELLNSQFITVNMQIGKTYKCYLDMSGNIAHIEEIDDGSLQYAFLINAVQNDAFAKRDTVSLRLMLKDGSKVTAVTNKKIKLNGNPKQPSLNILSDPSLKDVNGEIIPQVIQVSFDSDGNVSEFKFAVDNTSSEYGYDNTEFSLDFSQNASLTTSNGLRVYDRRYTFDTKTLVFVTYTNINDDEPYGVISGTSLTSGNKLINVYDADETLVVAAATKTINAKAYWPSGYLLVDNVRYVNEDGEFLKQISGYSMGSYVSYTEFEEGIIPDNIKRGDIVRVSRYNNKASYIEPYVSLSDNPAPKIFGDVDRGDCAIFAYVYSIGTSGIVTINPDSNKEQLGRLLSTGIRSSLQLPVVVYDAVNDSVYSGSKNDIYPMEHLDKNGDLAVTEKSIKVFINRDVNYAREVFVVYY